MEGKLLRGVILKQVLIIGKRVKHLAALLRVVGGCSPSVGWTPVVAVETESRPVLLNQLFSLTTLP